MMSLNYMTIKEIFTNIIDLCNISCEDVESVQHLSSFRKL